MPALDPPFIDHFAKAVAARGTSIAVVDQSGSIDYAELDRWSNALAATLVAEVGSGQDPVAIMSGHDVAAVAAFVAVAKAGRPAVFLDTTTPPARMRQVLGTAVPLATLYAARYAPSAAQLGEVSGRLIQIDPAARAEEAPSADGYPTDRVLAVVFTSGSTGAPKGVILGDTEMTTEVGNVEFFGNSDDRLGLPQPMSFIAGLGTIVRVLMTGGELHLCDPRREGIGGMVDWVAREQITSLNVTPHLMRTLAQAALDRGIVFDRLRSVSSGGEALLSGDVRLLRRCVGPDCVIMNASGSSEGWGLTMVVIDADYPLPDVGPVPAGAPMPGREVYLLDEHGARITEPGVVGAVTLDATNMARGYWNNAELTAQRFAVAADGTRTYRTGDLGRWNDRGELEYAGRADHMLKVRGYLVEPAEIETRLMGGGEVRECVVVGRAAAQEGVVQLVAYVAPEPARWVSSAALRRRLSTELPAYMVPQVLVEVPALPRNPNGKVDRLVLPEPPARPVEDRPRGWNSLQLTIASICCNALGLEQIGPRDDLFELGADSLAVEEIISAMHEELEMNVDSATLMQHPTIAELAALPRAVARRPVQGVLVTLADTADEAPPIFLIAGAAGLALQFRDLARALGAQRRVYGLQMHGLEGRGRPDLTIAAMARRYLRAMRTVQPSGPYYLAGHSLGAVVAYEMARRLHAAGEQVGLLALIDPLRGEDAPAGARALARIKPDAPAARRRAQGYTLQALRDRAGQDYPLVTRTYWRNRRERPFLAYWTVGLSIAHRYRAPSEPLVGVRSISYLAAQAFGPAPDLAAVLQPPPEVEVVAGDHLSMLRTPFVADLAGRLARALP